MGMKWLVRTHHLKNIVRDGTDGWEPFALSHDGLIVYCKKEVFVEDDEVKSSVHHKNWMGNEPDAEEGE